MLFNKVDGVRSFMYVLVFCLAVDIGIYAFSHPPLLLTSIIKGLFGSSGMIFLSAGIWWLLMLVGIGTMIRLKTRWVGMLVVGVSLLLWLLRILSPLGSMTLALEYPNLVWGILELFYILILVSIELMVFKR